MSRITSPISKKIKDYYTYMNPVVVMPDFFLDRIIKLKSKEELFEAISYKARFGGGSIRCIPTADIKGGNAVNIAYSLARMGVKVGLFTLGDEIASAVLNQVFSAFDDNVTMIIVNGNHGHTTSFEFPNEKGLRVNVMVSDVGDNADFGPEKVNSAKHLKILDSADAVIVANWASNIKGTLLAEYVFESSPKALHFIDPADIASRKEDFRDSLERIAQVTDVLSMNENECNSLGEALGVGILIPEEEYDPDGVRVAAKLLADKTRISVDLHTRKGTAWSNGRETAFVHAIKVETKTLTGAGDVWNAADVIGYLAGLDPKERLLFSNSSVSLYIRNASAAPPTINQVFELLERIGA